MSSLTMYVFYYWVAALTSIYPEDRVSRLARYDNDIPVVGGSDQHVLGNKDHTQNVLLVHMTQGLKMFVGALFLCVEDVHLLVPASCVNIPLKAEDRPSGDYFAAWNDNIGSAIMVYITCSDVFMYIINRQDRNPRNEACVHVCLVVTS